MARLRTIHRCTDCGSASPRWQGRCPSCGEWNSLVEEVEEVGAAAAAHIALLTATAGGGEAKAVPIGDVDATAWAPQPTTVPELDRVLGGGLVPGSVTLLGGEPGIGKSTLLLQALGAMASMGRRCLLVSGEESTQQVRLRAGRLGALAPELFLLSSTSLPHVLAQVVEVDPAVLVVDSIQTVHDPGLGSPPGSVTQVRGCAHALVHVAKDRGMAVVLVGHVTKEGALAGPRVLEHVVDTVLSFEGERHHALRLLRASKHRFGATGELGLFEMGDEGLLGVPDAGALFLSDRRLGIPGSVVVPALEGQRPLLVELQALVTSSEIPIPRRTATGVDSSRLSLLLAVLEQRVGIPLGRSDVYASAVGGVRITEPGADLALALAIASAHAGVAVPPDVVACGEVGLAGEVRQVSQTDRRLAEAARIGFRRAVIPASAPEVPSGIEAIRVATLANAVDLLGLRRRSDR